MDLWEEAAEVLQDPVEEEEAEVEESTCAVPTVTPATTTRIRLRNSIWWSALGCTQAHPNIRYPRTEPMAMAVATAM